MQSKSINCYIGVYNSAQPDKGFYHARFDSQSGTLEQAQLIPGIEDPSFLCLSPDGNTLYVASEKGQDAEVQAFRLDAEGQPRALGRLVLPAGGLCHLSCSPDGRTLAASAYSSGNVLSIHLTADGALEALVSNIHHQGKSIHPERQEGPHVHSATFSPDGRYLLVCDLGRDMLSSYRVNQETSALTLSGEQASPAGSGPRHAAFSRGGRHLYVVSELDNQVLSYAYQADSGSLTLLHSIPTLQQDFSGESTAAHIALSPRGDYLYVSNRGADSITCFSLDEKGLPQAPRHYPIGGKTPRHFTLSRDGRHVLVAHQNSNSLKVFALNASDGSLGETLSTLSIPSPVCVLLR